MSRQTTTIRHHLAEATGGIRKSVTCDAMIREIRPEDATVKVVNSLFYTFHLPSHCYFENLNVAPNIKLPA